MARSLRRSALVIIVLLLAVMMLSSGALASRTIVEDDFERADGKPPTKEKWDVFKESDDDVVIIEDDTLLIEGEAFVKTTTPIAFHSLELAIQVDVAIR
ncbi:MAG: hypothetical protein KAQ96_10800, partial [Thermoplasmata archaeon]|nr:hypothetical protein [Thermoplasmata archaeon]